MFLNKKVQEQTEKRKRDRKAKVPSQPAASPRAGAAGGAAGDNKKKAVARPKTENEEQLLNVIDDLRNDLQLRDEEFQDQRAYLDKIVIQNDYLKAELRKIQLEKIAIDAKLNKIRTVKELDTNFAKIDDGTFFESRKTNTLQLKASLSNSLMDQYKANKGWMYAAKWARIWVEGFRERKDQREEIDLAFETNTI